MTQDREAWAYQDKPKDTDIPMSFLLICPNLYIIRTSLPFSYL